MVLVKMSVIYQNYSEYWAKVSRFLAGNYQEVYKNWNLRFQKLKLLCKVGFFWKEYRLFSVLDLIRKSFCTLGDIFRPDCQNRILRIGKKTLRKLICFEVFVHSKTFPGIGQKLSGLWEKIFGQGFQKCISTCRGDQVEQNQLVQKSFYK